MFSSSDCWILCKVAFALAGFCRTRTARGSVVGISLSWASNRAIKEIVRYGHTCIYTWCEISTFLYMHYCYWLYNSRFGWAWGHTHSYIITICSNNNCVDRYHELLFFNQIIMIIINRRKIKTRFPFNRLHIWISHTHIVAEVLVYYDIIIYRNLVLLPITILTMLPWVNLVSWSSILPIYNIII